MAVNWTKNLQKRASDISEEGMYEVLFSIHHPKANDFSKHCCNLFFPRIRQQLTNKMVDDLRCDYQQAITYRDCQIQAI